MHAVSILLGLAALPAFSVALPPTRRGVPSIDDQAPRNAPIQVCSTKGAVGCPEQIVPFGEVCQGLNGPVAQVMVQATFEVEVEESGHVGLKNHKYPVECTFYTTSDCSGKKWKADSDKNIAVGEHGMPSGIQAAKCKGPKAPKV